MRIKLFLKKLIKGNNPFIVKQTVFQWDRQFKDGKWNFLLDLQKNTECIIKRLEEIKDHLNSDLRILDLGCGNGGLLKSLINRDIKFVYLGLDISSKAIRDLKDNYKNSNTSFSVRDISKLNKSDFINFNVIIVSEVLYYTNYIKVVKDIKKYSNKGSFVIISIYQSWRSIFIWIWIKLILKVVSIDKIQLNNVVWKVAKCKI